MEHLDVGKPHIDSALPCKTLSNASFPKRDSAINEQLSLAARSPDLQMEMSTAYNPRNLCHVRSLTKVESIAACCKAFTVKRKFQYIFFFFPQASNQCDDVLGGFAEINITILVAK